MDLNNQLSSSIIENTHGWSKEKTSPKCDGSQNSASSKIFHTEGL